MSDIKQIEVQVHLPNCRKCGKKLEFHNWSWKWIAADGSGKWCTARDFHEPAS